MNRFIYGFCACSLSAMLWPSLAPIWCLPILCLLVLFCLKKAPFFAGIFFAVLWLSAFFKCLYLHQNAEKPQQIQFTAQIVTLVSQNSDWISFDVRVIPQRQNLSFFETIVSSNVQRYYRLTWQKPAKIELGQIWQFSARMKGISSIQNQGGFNQQKHLISRHITAKGRVKQAELLSHASSIRQEIIDITLPVLAKLTEGEILRALIFGDKSQLSEQRWQQLRQTGAGHLVAISGLHLSVVFGLFYGLLILLSRLFVASQHRGYGVGIILIAAGITLGYGYLSGFAVATQRALLMMLLLVIFTVVKQYSNSWDRLLYALCIVLLLDPFAMLSAGFWLSFLALSIILLAVKPERIEAEPNLAHLQDKPQAIFVRVSTTLKRFYHKAVLGIKVLWAIQWRLAIGLGLLQAVLFGTMSPHSIWLNLLFVPWFSVVVIPVAMLSFCLWLAMFVVLRVLTLEPAMINGGGEVLFYLANLSLAPFVWLLSISDHLPLSLVKITEQWIIAIVFLCIALGLLYYRRYSSRYTTWTWYGVAMLLCLPIVLQTYAVSRHELHVGHQPNAAPHWQMHVLDVAQGMAVVLQQGQHGVIYDTGAAYGDFSYAARAIVPFIAAKGVTRIDYIVVSHADNDHVGGLSLLSQTYPNSKIIADFNVKPYAKRPANQTCRGKLWWQGIELQFIDNTLQSDNDNDQSCVMRLDDGKSAVLLTGDIEAPRERALLKADVTLAVEVLLVPHHGSRTSSTPAFIAAVQPQVAIVTAGFANQYGFPKNDVMARYQDRGISTLHTGHQGQISLSFTEKGYKIATYRQQLAPFWYNQLFKFGESLKAE
ncbi:DNA internalization-related competence protein ComEC/Rec2 [Shewanella litoralis]